MKNTSRIPTLLVAAGALALGSATLQAQFSYYDAVDLAQYTAAFPTAVPNLYVTSTGAPLLATTGDGTPEWRYRNTGPGIPDWNGNGYQMRWVEGDVPGYEAISGLTPNATYHVRVYGTYPANTLTLGSRYGVQIGYDNVSFSIVDNRGAEPINWVDNSSMLGATVATTNITSDTRFWSAIPDAVADASGNLNIYMQLPWQLSDGTSNDRFILDGFALEVVPEPATFALAGLGMAALLVFRRRR